MTAPAQRVRIVRAPIGEAPQWVRDAWIGLELPLAGPDPITVEAGGVLSGPHSRLGYWIRKLTRGFERVSGYVVPSARAIEILGRTRPEAAAWWTDNAPRFLGPHEMFIFDGPACEPMPGPAAGAPWG